MDTLKSDVSVKWSVSNYYYYYYCYEEDSRGESPYWGIMGHINARKVIINCFLPLKNYESVSVDMDRDGREAVNGSAGMSVHSAQCVSTLTGTDHQVSKYYTDKQISF